MAPEAPACALLQALEWPRFEGEAPRAVDLPTRPCACLPGRAGAPQTHALAAAPPRFRLHSRACARMRPCPLVAVLVALLLAGGALAEHELKASCLNDCNGRGDCMQGICICSRHMCLVHPPP